MLRSRLYASWGVRYHGSSISRSVYYWNPVSEAFHGVSEAGLQGVSRSLGTFHVVHEVPWGVSVVLQWNNGTSHGVSGAFQGISESFRSVREGFRSMSGGFKGFQWHSIGNRGPSVARRKSQGFQGFQECYKMLQRN